MTNTVTINVSNTAAGTTTTGADDDDSSTMSTLESLLLAYGSLLLMALVPIVLGSWRSVRQKRVQQKQAAHAAQLRVQQQEPQQQQQQHHHHHHHHHSVGGRESRSHHSSSRSRSSSTRHYRSDSGDLRTPPQPTPRPPPPPPRQPDPPPPPTFTSASTGDLLRLAAHATIVILAGALSCKYFSRPALLVALKAYAYVLGALALAHSLSPICRLLVPSSVPNSTFHVLFVKSDQLRRRSLVNYKFSTYDVICVALSLCVGVWYVLQRHWLPNNMLALACSISAIELLQLNNMVTGYIMMGIYYLDTVYFGVGQQLWEQLAASVDLPIAIMFPKETPAADRATTATVIAPHPAAASLMVQANFALFDVADVVIPGIFLALMLRFDQQLRATATAAAAAEAAEQARHSPDSAATVPPPTVAMRRTLNVYFYATLCGYVLAVLATWSLLVAFGRAYTQTAFVVPGCLVPPMLVAVHSGELRGFFAYDDAVSVDVPSTTATKIMDNNGDGDRNRTQKRA